jgi:hypothetical protein
VVNLVEQLSSSSTSSEPQKKQSKKVKFAMNWNVQIDRGLLPENRVELKLCRQSLAFLYGLKVNVLKAIPQKMKTVNSSGS